MERTPFELWDTESANLLDTYRTEEEALADVADTVKSHGLESAKHLLLGYEEENGRSRVIAKGLALAERALATSPLA
jgi:hypothetical protein